MGKNQKNKMNKKTELKTLIESQKSMMEKGCLSRFGIAYLEGLEKAYDILYPMQVEVKKV